MQQDTSNSPSAREAGVADLTFFLDLPLSPPFSSSPAHDQISKLQGSKKRKNISCNTTFAFRRRCWCRSVDSGCRSSRRHLRRNRKARPTLGCIAANQPLDAIPINKLGPLGAFTTPNFIFISHPSLWLLCLPGRTCLEASLPGQTDVRSRGGQKGQTFGANSNG